MFDKHSGSLNCHSNKICSPVFSVREKSGSYKGYKAGDDELERWRTFCASLRSARLSQLLREMQKVNKVLKLINSRR